MKTGALVGLLSIAVLRAQTAEEFLRQADQLANTSQKLAAIELLSDAVQRFPENVPLLLRASELLVDIGQIAAAEPLLSRVRQLAPQGLDAIRLQGEARLRVGDLPGAERFFEEFLRHGESAFVRQRLGYVQILQKKDRSALEHARRAVDLEPDNSRYHRFLATALDQVGDREAAFHELKVAYRLAPEDAQLLYQLGQRRKSEGHPQQALEYFELANEIDGENPLYHEELSAVYDSLGMRDKAIEHANQAIDLRAAFDDYLRALAVSRQGRPEEAIDFMRQTVERTPRFITGRLFLAELLEKAGKKKEALDLYLQVLDLDPLDQSAREKGAWLYYETGNLESALRLLKEASSRGPNERFLEAHQQMLDGHWSAALKIFQEMEADNPLNRELLQLIGFCLKSLGRRSEAIRYIEKSGTVPGTPDVVPLTREIRFDGALELVRQARWDEALRQIDDLLREGPPTADMLFNAAYCRQRLGQIDPAIEQYLRGLKMSPNASWAHMNLATCFYLRERYSEGAQQYEWVVRHKPTADAHSQLGLCYSHLNRLAEADVHFRRASELGLDTAALNYNRGLTLFRLGRQAEGLVYLRRASSMGYSPATLFLRRAVRTKPRT